MKRKTVLFCALGAALTIAGTAHVSAQVFNAPEPQASSTQVTAVAADRSVDLDQQSRELLTQYLQQRSQVALGTAHRTPATSVVPVSAAQATRDRELQRDMTTFAQTVSDSGEARSERVGLSIDLDVESVKDHGDTKVITYQEVGTVAWHLVGKADSRAEWGYALDHTTTLKLVAGQWTIHEDQLHDGHPFTAVKKGHKRSADGN